MADAMYMTITATRRYLASAVFLAIISKLGDDLEDVSFDDESATVFVVSTVNAEAPVINVIRDVTGSKITKSTTDVVTVDVDFMSPSEGPPYRYYVRDGKRQIVYAEFPSPDFNGRWT